jgi:membrane-associated phospholipid phosphatase
VAKVRRFRDRARHARCNRRWLDKNAVRTTHAAGPHSGHSPSFERRLAARLGATDEAASVPFGTKLTICLLATTVNAALYFVPNHVVLRPLVEVPWTPVDAMVPFVQATFWVYFSDYFLVGSAFMLSRTWADVKWFARSYFALLFTGALIHVLWPTAFPRESFPVVGDDLTARALAALRQIDMPTSAMPSMHVAGSFLAAFSLWRRPQLLWVWTAWATAVAISTLTVKQHYAVDVLAGLLMAVVFWAGFFWAPVARGRHPRGRRLASTSW